MIIKDLASSSSTVLVTGGSGGIGQAITKKLAKAGFGVINADVAGPTEEVEGVEYKNCDVSNGADVDDLFKWLNDKGSLPEVLVLNAGKGIHEQLTEGDPEKWLDILQLNVMGVLRCIRAFVPPMTERKKGHVVFISSVAATKAYTYGGIYSASKAAVEMIAETLRIETLPDIKVTIIAAGVTDTGFFENQVSGHNSVESIGVGSLSAEDVAEDVLYAITKKGGSINKIVSRPAGQDF
jgi:NADP-dependent 3-hydroxy acid dehydrogenase YdfG